MHPLTGLRGTRAHVAWISATPQAMQPTVKSYLLTCADKERQTHPPNTTRSQGLCSTELTVAAFAVKELNSPYLSYNPQQLWQVADQVEMLQSLSSTMRAAALDGAPPNTLRLTLHPAGPGVYPGKVVLVSDGDVRLLDVEFVAVRTSQEVTLEFNNPARDKLLQEVGRLCAALLKC